MAVADDEDHLTPSGIALAEIERRSQHSIIENVRGDHWRVHHHGAGIGRTSVNGWSGINGTADNGHAPAGAVLIFF